MNRMPMTINHFKLYNKIQWLFGMFLMYSHYHYQVMEHFRHPERNPVPVK